VAEPAIDLRPRGTGEVLDDAWRLALADLPVLLALNTPFLAPALAALLWMLCRVPGARGTALVWPALAAALVALSGLGSGASQEWLRRRLDGASPRPLACLGAAARRALEHAAARALVVAGVLVGSFLLVLPGLSLWAASAPVHAIIAGRRGRGDEVWGQLWRDATVGPARSVAVTLTRLALLLVAAINAHLLVHVALWAADAFAGVDTALLSVQLGLFTNPAYTVALFMVCWLLLSPFFEATNFLLHLDARTRREGLDLLYRIRRAFPGREGSQPLRAAPASVASVRSLLLATAGLLVMTSGAPAADTELDVVRRVKAKVEAVTGEVKAADPYPGGQAWVRRLQSAADQLDAAGGRGRHGWFRKALAGFAGRDREGAVAVLGQVHRRLALVEDVLSRRPQAPPGQLPGATDAPDPEQVKALLGDHAPRPRPGEAPKKTRAAEEDRERQKPAVEEADRPARARGGGGRTEPLVSGGGPGSLAWAALVGLAVCVIVTAAYLYWTSRRARGPRRPAAPAAQRGGPQELPQPGATDPDKLWARAEALASQGLFAEAVRMLFLAVLLDLDSRRLLHYEKSRTNGEYLRELRRCERALDTLHGPFEDLARRFDEAWYGGRPCGAGEYAACRDLALRVRERHRAA
jgi:hypothetical protein